MKHAKIFLIAAVLFMLPVSIHAQDIHDQTFPVKHQNPLDSQLKVKIGQPAPDFSLPSTDGTMVSLSDYKGKKNIMLSFVPAAWTPVCSDQWPGYRLIKDMFEADNTQVIGISTDNVPTLYAWCNAMEGLWFPVLSDFYPHGKVAQKYGILRSNGTAERAIFLIDKQGIIRYIDVHDINRRPPLEPIIKALQEINAQK